MEMDWANDGVDGAVANHIPPSALGNLRAKEDADDLVMALGGEGAEQGGAQEANADDAEKASQKSAWGGAPTAASGHAAAARGDPDTKAGQQRRGRRRAG